jgi:hypothetical protein
MLRYTGRGEEAANNIQETGIAHCETEIIGREIRNKYKISAVKFEGKDGLNV